MGVYKIVTWGWSKEVWSGALKKSVTAPEVTHYIEAALIEHVQIEPYFVGRGTNSMDDGDYVTIHMHSGSSIQCMSNHEGVQLILDLLELAKREAS